MASPFVGEIRPVGFSFAPVGWLLCQGQLVPISSYATLFELIGTYYGGNGTTTFGLPDLRGRTPIHFGTSNYGSTFVIGEQLGTESVSLSSNELPRHAHGITVQGALGTVSLPQNHFLAGSSDGQYSLSGTSLSGNILQNSGGSQPHENRQPFLCINYIIAYAGAYPSS